MSVVAAAPKNKSRDATTRSSQMPAMRPLNMATKKAAAPMAACAAGMPTAFSRNAGAHSRTENSTATTKPSVSQ